jgi:hypothetical protein
MGAPTSGLPSFRRWIDITVGVVAALAALATTSYTQSVTLHLLDGDGAPASDAYVRYHYHGHLINPVHPLSYVARNSVIVRADSSGRVTIRGRVHVRWPLPPSTPPELLIDGVYVPRLHNSFGPIAAGAMSRPGVFMIDENRERVTVFDVSHTPEQWELSLRNLFDMIRATIEPSSMAPALVGHAGTAALMRELVAHLRREYAALLAAHGGRRRERPQVPAYAATDQERRAWQEQVDAALAREPVWGPYLERTWRSNLTELDRWAGSRRRE